MEARICRTCNESQPLDQFGEYQGRKGTVHRKECKMCRRIATAKRYAENPDVRAKMKATAKNHILQIKYGLTLVQLDQMHKDVDSKCQICSNPYERLHVDHCHTEGHVRGLLCGSCNRGLGLFKDNPEYLANAIQYLKEN